MPNRILANYFLVLVWSNIVKSKVSLNPPNSISDPLSIKTRMSETKHQGSEEEIRASPDCTSVAVFCRAEW